MRMDYERAVLVAVSEIFVGRCALRDCRYFGGKKPSFLSVIFRSKIAHPTFSAQGQVLVACSAGKLKIL